MSDGHVPSILRSVEIPRSSLVRFFPVGTVGLQLSDGGLSAVAQTVCVCVFYAVDRFPKDAPTISVSSDHSTPSPPWSRAVALTPATACLCMYVCIFSQVSQVLI
jgi:hypothetical protein